MWTFIMQSVAFISSMSQDRIKLIFSHTNKSYIFREKFLLLAPMTTYLKDLTQSIALLQDAANATLLLRHISLKVVLVIDDNMFAD